MEKEYSLMLFGLFLGVNRIFPNHLIDPRVLKVIHDPNEMFDFLEGQTKENTNDKRQTEENTNDIGLAMMRLSELYQEFQKESRNQEALNEKMLHLKLVIGLHQRPLDDYIEFENLTEEI